MPDIKRRVVAVILGIALAVALGACDSGDPPGTTLPGDSDTTAPIGS